MTDLKNVFICFVCKSVTLKQAKTHKCCGKTTEYVGWFEGTDDRE